MYKSGQLIKLVMNFSNQDTIIYLSDNLLIFQFVNDVQFQFKWTILVFCYPNKILINYHASLKS